MVTSLIARNMDNFKFEVTIVCSWSHVIWGILAVLMQNQGRYNNHSAINCTWESTRILSLKCGLVADKSYCVYHTRLRYECQQIAHVSNWSARFVKHCSPKYTSIQR